MEDGERIPIVIEQPAELAANENLRDDGTLVIELPVDEVACGEGAVEGEAAEIREDEEAEGEIVVCAPREGADPVAQMSEAMRVDVGPVEVGSLPNADGIYSLGARVVF